jgi:hypothetical protein
MRLPRRLIRKARLAGLGQTGDHRGSQSAGSVA